MKLDTEPRLAGLPAALIDWARAVVRAFNGNYDAQATKDGSQDALIAQAQPAGMVGQFANSSAPAGWLKCNGAVVNRADYPALFAAIGTTYNTGGETGTQFRLPELRGEFVRGLDDGRGVDASRAIGTAQGHQFQGHNHRITSGIAAAFGPPYTGVVVGSYIGNEDMSTSRGTYAITIEGDGSHGSPAVGSETRPRNVALLYCIKT